VIGLSVLARGSIQDKLRWTFSLYDINNDGIITKDELARIIASIYDLMGKGVEPIIEESTSKDHVERVFQVLNRFISLFNSSSFITSSTKTDSFVSNQLKEDLFVFNLFVL